MPGSRLWSRSASKSNVFFANETSQCSKNFILTHQFLELSAEFIKLPPSCNGRNSVEEFLYVHHAPDHQENTLSCCQSHFTPLQKFFFIRICQFFSYPTDRQTHKHKIITSLLEITAVCESHNTCCHNKCLHRQQIINRKKPRF